jgi:ribosome-associated translation inhibitor RaiA
MLIKNIERLKFICDQVFEIVNSFSEMITQKLNQLIIHFTKSIELLFHFDIIQNKSKTCK